MHPESPPLHQLPPDKARQLVDEGFAIIDGPYQPSELNHLSQAYDDGLAMADPADVRVSSSTRAWDIVSRTPEFERVYTYAPLLQAARIVVGERFKLSATCFRSLNPRASAQSLHVDVQFQEDGWPILGFILMVDAFSSETGATRFVRGSHERQYEPNGLSVDATRQTDAETLACGPAGAMIIFNGSTWHGHSCNVTERQRRSIQGHFVPCHSRTVIDYGPRLDAKSLARIGTLGKQVLGLISAAQQPVAAVRER
jgi:ectoine hydroxylase-related dioxygenase (phytanoyl-CoA dioxygenase family)